MSVRPRFPRSTCCVPFCGRLSTLFRPGEEWLCADHWRLVDRHLRRFYRARLRQLYDRWAAKPEDTRDSLMAARRWHRAHDLIWRRIKAQAVGRAGEMPL